MDESQNDILVSVVMPCLDEERTVGKCVQNALSALEKMDVKSEVLVWADKLREIIKQK